MRALLIPVAALLVGLAGGYAWSTIGAVPAAPKPPKARFIALPASPEEEPGTLDEQWTERAADGPDTAADDSSEQAAVYYPGCNAVRAAGKAPLHSGDPGYRSEMDGDGDGIACEPHRRP